MLNMGLASTLCLGMRSQGDREEGRVVLNVFDEPSMVVGCRQLLAWRIGICGNVGVRNSETASSKDIKYNKKVRKNRNLNCVWYSAVYIGLKLARGA